MSRPPFNDDLPGWLLRCVSYVGGALLGPVFLAGSIVASRNRKRAGMSRALASAPVEEEEITSETAAALDRARASLARGEGIPHEDILREFGLGE